MIDPVREEEGCENGSLMMTCMPSRCEVTHLTITGEWTRPNINEVCPPIIPHLLLLLLRDNGLSFLAIDFI